MKEVGSKLPEGEDKLLANGNRACKMAGRVSPSAA